MEQPAADKWKACLEYIRRQLPEKEFDTWFKPLAFVEYKGERLTVSVPTKYVGDYIREKHRELVAGALAQIFGRTTQLIWRNAEAVEQWEREVRLRQQQTQTGPEKFRKVSEPPAPLAPQLNACYTFDSFVEGQSNKLARTVAISIAEKPGQSTFNPFFLYGPSGVGKTHLVNAIGIRIRELYPEKRVLFVSAHVFKTQYTDSVVHNTTNDFISFYQSIEVLIIDDIQEITTVKTLQTFFHIFNHLQQNGRQLIITCDQPPALLKDMEERMLTRFKWGMIVPMEKPDTALRKAILESKIKRDGLSFPPEVVQYIAQNVESSVRELEGIINSIMAYSVADDCDIDLQLTARVVARIVNLERKELSPEGIMHTVARQLGTKVRDMQSKSRRQSIVQARQLAMYLCHKYTDLSYAQIGRAMGGRDHSTVLYGCDQVAQRISMSADFRHKVEAIEAGLKK